MKEGGGILEESLCEIVNGWSIFEGWYWGGGYGGGLFVLGGGDGVGEVGLGWEKEGKWKLVVGSWDG